MLRFVSRAWVPVAGAALAAMAGTAQAVVFDLADDFSLVSNPNGAWSYNQGNSPLTALVADWGGVIGETFWTTTGTAVVPPAWTKAVTAQVGAHDWAIGDAIVHTSNGSSVAPANVRWTAPADGEIDITGTVWDAQFNAGRDASWVLFVDGASKAARGSIFGLLRGDASATFAANISLGESLTDIDVQAGDIVELAFFTSTSLGHFAGVELTIDFTEIPAPGVAAAFGAMGIAGLRRRR